MLQTIELTLDSANDVRAAKWRARFSLFVWFALVAAICGMVILLLTRSRPDPSIIGWLLYAAGAVVVLRQPRHGIYLIIFLSLIADATLLPWYPFAKNFSSRESLLYVNDAIIINPIESYLILALFSWLGTAAVRRKLSFVKGRLLIPMLVFTAFVLFGLFYGLSRNGNTNVALWEARPLIYLPLIFILTTNLIKERAHVSILLWFIALGLFVEGIAGVAFVVGTLEGDLTGVQAITEHSAAVHMNTLFILCIAAWMYSRSYAKRIVFPLLIPPVLVTYVATQRRAAFVALAFALLLVAIAALRDRRKALLLALPPLLVIGLAYLLAFWNVDTALGVPAQAVKSVIAPGQLSQADQGSNLYRVLENINIQFTIHVSPIFGIGFGQKFYHIVALPNISWFVWWEYITHNSILWLWMKMGVGGFLAALFLTGLGVIKGSELLWEMPSDDLKMANLVATTYVGMHFLYAYVDMGWEAQSTLYLGIAFGLINLMPRLLAQPELTVPPRWPWQRAQDGDERVSSLPSPAPVSDLRTI